MKLQLTTLAALLLPLAAMGMPNPNPEAAAAPAAAAEPAPEVGVEIIDLPLDTRDISPEAIGLEKRSNAVCKIVNSSSSSVKCRKGPGFSYGVEAYVIPGHSYAFDCYKKGSCYNGNWIYKFLLKPYSPLAKWASQIGAAIKSMHDAGWTHVDLKPGNVVLDSKNNAKLVDISGTGCWTWEYLSFGMEQIVKGDENIDL
ncbi:hypothetical protein BJY01DRAFT_252858 [Aspergillus pseudoustus]|uniref:Protein kinase domain-containing protein n=1 Tax=Aspergillus pseudoustus TaxID=1810923 RepID=A0ABR4J6V2_9EURO